MRLTIPLLLAAACLFAEPVCRTPLGAPCFSIVTKREQTYLFRDGIADLGSYTAIKTRAQASDGSFAVITEYSSVTLQGRYQRREREFYDGSANLRYWLAPVKKTWVRNQPHIAPRPPRPPRINAECQPLLVSKGTSIEKSAWKRFSDSTHSTGAPTFRVAVPPTCGMPRRSIAQRCAANVWRRKASDFPC
ncbi:MAG: hypothetical protein SGI92_18200 [Bryobacteraceae bacterium]|nr:hypothetical protein [Bryobacteraceae bacterium]